MEADETFTRLLRALEGRLLSAEVRHSSAAASELLADEFEEFGSSGRVFDKPQVIDSLRAEGPRGERSVLGFRTNVLAPGVVLVTYCLVRPDGSGETHSLRSSIRKRIGERWQMVFHQGTPSPEPRR